MPLYTCRCEVCKKPQTYFKKVSECYDTPTCCDVPTTKTLDAPMIGAMSFTGHKGFEIPGSNAWIEDGAQMKAFMTKNNYISETEGTQEATLQRANREKAQDRKLEEAVITAYQAHN